MNHFTIEYKKVSGKGWGLHFNNIPKALRDAMPFFQSDRWFDDRVTDEVGYLFIELSSCSRRIPCRLAAYSPRVRPWGL